MLSVGKLIIVDVLAICGTARSTCTISLQQKRTQSSTTSTEVHFVFIPVCLQVKRTIEMIMDDNRAREAVKGAPKDFNSVVSEPVDVLKFHPETDLRKILPPAQLHSILSVNAFYDYIYQLCPEVARRYAKDSGVMPSPIHGDSDFPGNECRQLLKPESVAKLRNLIPVITPEMFSESKDDIEDLEHFALVFETIRKVAVCLEKLNIIVSRVMTPKLFDGWQDSFTEFKKSFQSLSEDYLKLRPRKANQSLTSPKVWVISEEMPQWIEENNCSLFRVSEQAFETTHSHYASFEPNFSVDKAGLLSDWKKNSSKRNRSSAVDHPSLGTRSGTQKKRKLRELEEEKSSESTSNHLTRLLYSVGIERSAVIESSSSSSSSSVPPATSADYPHHYGNPVKAQEKRRNALAAYTRTKFPAESRDRLLYCADRYVAKSNGEKVGVAPWSLEF
jgi:hypothetical protein